jgi:hypothetical protein
MPTQKGQKGSARTSPSRGPPLQPEILAKPVDLVHALPKAFNMPMMVGSVWAAPQRSLV